MFYKIRSTNKKTTYKMLSRSLIHIDYTPFTVCSNDLKYQRIAPSIIIGMAHSHIRTAWQTHANHQILLCNLCTRVCLCSLTSPVQIKRSYILRYAKKNMAMSTADNHDEFDRILMPSNLSHFSRSHSERSPMSSAFV